MWTKWWVKEGVFYSINIKHGALIITWTMDRSWWEISFSRQKDYWVFVIGPLGLCHWYDPLKRRM